MNHLVNVFLWILCGVITFGRFQYDSWSKFGRPPHRYDPDHFGLQLAISFTGPIGFILTIILTIIAKEDYSICFFCPPDPNEEPTEWTDVGWKRWLEYRGNQLATQVGKRRAALRRKRS